MRWLGHAALAMVTAAVIGWTGATAGFTSAHDADGRSHILATDVGPTR